MSGSKTRALPLATQIGYVCRMVRLQRKMEIDELAARAGLTERAIRTLERGEGTRQTIDVMAVVAWALDFEWEFHARNAKAKYTASGTETEGHDREDGHGAEHESPTGEAGDAQPLSGNQP